MDRRIGSLGTTVPGDPRYWRSDLKTYHGFLDYSRPAHSTRARRKSAPTQAQVTPLRNSLMPGVIDRMGRLLKSALQRKHVSISVERITITLYMG
jgi:hypothetical protein